MGVRPGATWQDVGPGGCAPPAFDKVHLHFSSPSTEKITIKILDIKGSLIFQEEINSVDSELDLSKIYNGVYFVKVEGEKLYPVIRLVKIN
ncbi:MAG: T9SS type A sorting domain-containing protein [Bacteroidetes bacterium]|nr:T9SS type A sorting domain-containing protein [Bacteroidota bacterium]